MLRRLAYHALVYGLTTALGRLLNWLLTPLYAYRLPVEDFGRLSELYSYVVFGTIAASMGMETAYLRFGEKGQAGAFRRVLLLSLLVGGLIGGLLAVLVPWLSEPLGYRGREVLLWLTIAVWTVDAWANIALVHQRAVEAPFRYATIQISHVIMLIGLNLYGVGWQGLGLTFVLLANLIASLVKLVWALVWAPLHQKPTSQAPTLRMLTRYGSMLALMGLLGATNDVLDRILLAQYSRIETAFYGAAYKVATLLALFVQAYRMAAEPLLLRAEAESGRLYARTWEAFHFVGLLGVMVFSVWAQPLLTTQWGGFLPAPLLPPAYWEALWVVPILLFANLFMGSLVQASVWYKRREKPDIGLLIAATGSLITLVGNLYGIPRFGYGACAITTLLSYAGMSFLSVSLGRKVLPGAFPMPWTTVASLLAVTVIYGAQGTEWFPRLLWSLSGVALMSIMAWWRLRR